MYTKKKDNKFKVNIRKNNLIEQKIFEDKLQLYKLSELNEINQRNFNLKEIEYKMKEEEDDYNNSVYNISVSKDKNFLCDIIFSNELFSKSLGFNEKLYFSEKNNFGTNSVKFNENIFINLNEEEKDKKEDINNLIKNIQLFTRMKKERRKNYMIDLQYNNCFFNSIENGSTKIKDRIISRFSKEYKKSIKQNESSTIPVIHSRVSSQPINTPYLRKNKIVKNNNYTINLYDDYSNNKYINGINNISEYNTNEENKNKKKNRILDITNIYEENKMNGNSLIYLKDYNKKEARLEEQYAFDSSGNQKFLCIKRFGEENNEIKNDNNIINKNKKNMKNNHLKEIVIKNINMKNPYKNLKKCKSKNNNSNIIERFVFYSPQISYKNIFSPNSKNYLGKLYKKLPDKINGNYTSLIKEKVNNIKKNINNNLKNSKSCIFNQWKNKIINKNIKANNNLNNSNNYNIKFLNSFNKVINSENDINNHTINNSRNNYNNNINNLDSNHKNLYSFNSDNNIIKENDIYNSVRNNKEFNNRIYFPIKNAENVKVDYSNKNNYKYHEIKMSKERQNKKINIVKNNISKSKIDKNKIINLTNIENIKILKKYNNIYKIIKDNTKIKNEKNKYV